MGLGAPPDLSGAFPERVLPAEFGRDDERVRQSYLLFIPGQFLHPYWLIPVLPGVGSEREGASRGPALRGDRRPMPELGAFGLKPR